MRYGWRGQTAIRWTLTGFILLLLAYLAAKLVLEIICTGNSKLKLYSYKTTELGMVPKEPKRTAPQKCSDMLKLFYFHSQNPCCFSTNCTRWVTPHTNV